MAASVVPALIAALHARASADLPNTVVLLGPGITDDPGDYLMVGVDDPNEDEDAVEVADVTQEPMAFGSTRPRREEGFIHMAARSRNGDSDLQAALNAVYVIEDALAQALRTTDSLGVAGVMKLGNGARSRLTWNLDDYGAVATLQYDIAFDAAI